MLVSRNSLQHYNLTSISYLRKKLFFHLLQVSLENDAELSAPSLGLTKAGEYFLHHVMLPSGVAHLQWPNDQCGDKAQMFSLMGKTESSSHLRVWLDFQWNFVTTEFIPNLTSLTFLKLPPKITLLADSTAESTAQWTLLGTSAKTLPFGDRLCTKR